ncbi:hypothetical protein B296_00018098 [Ensete ventricosum]|uniref:Uncharacterized protein n=1 Tax=Ensete ventricosum TaxID=4639 RepID=A0A427AXM4_ENSVE|nr:hypothetical protein B296_00018098 [Ensete ventricosum]
MGDKITELRNQISELKAGHALKVVAAAEQWANDLEVEVRQLRSKLGESERVHKELRKELEGTERHLVEFQCLLKESRGKVLIDGGSTSVVVEDVAAA